MKILCWLGVHTWSWIKRPPDDFPRDHAVLLKCRCCGRFDTVYGR